MRVAYADPPYIGQAARHYAALDPNAAEVDHAALLARLNADFDGWALSMSATVESFAAILPHVPREARVCAWVKPFAAFKRNVPVAYAWEPVIVKAARKPVVEGASHVMRDWLACPIAMEAGFPGAKPAGFCLWLFDVLGLQPGDSFVDLYPGSGAVQRAFDGWAAGRAGAVRPQLELTGQETKEQRAERIAASAKSRASQK